MSLRSQLWELTVETVSTPFSGFMRVVQLGWTARSAVELNIFIIVLSALAQYLAFWAANAASETPVEPMMVTSGPMIDAAFMGFLTLFLIVGIWLMGRFNGRDTSIIDVAVMYGWFQVLLIAAQIILVPISIIVPSVGGFAIAILIILAQPYYLVSGIMAVHGFTQPLSVLGGLLLVVFVSALLLGPVALALGIEITGFTNV